MRGEQQTWTQIAIDSWFLGAEACAVVGLRSLRLVSGGPEACSEARLMITEKIECGIELSVGLMAGRLGSTPKAVVGRCVTHYLEGVRANRIRLSQR